MTVVVNFTGYTPPARYDTIPWTDAQIEEATTSDGTFTLIDTVSLGTPDVDPAAPAARDFTTSLGTAPDLWYRVIYVDGSAGTSEPTLPVHNVADAAPFATVAELARILHIRTVPIPAAQEAAMERVLQAAAGEIEAELNRPDGDMLEDWELKLCAQVNLDRAADLWRHTESVPGIVGIPDEAMPSTFGRYSWNRYAERLAPIKRQWGLA